MINDIYVIMYIYVSLILTYVNSKVDHELNFTMQKIRSKFLYKFNMYCFISLINGKATKFLQFQLRYKFLKYSSWIRWIEYIRNLRSYYVKCNAAWTCDADVLWFPIRLNHSSVFRSFVLSIPPAFGWGDYKYHPKVHVCMYDCNTK